MAGEQPASDILDLIAVLPDDAEPAVWGRAAGAFGTIDEMYKDDPARRARFRAFAVPRLRPQLARLGWTPRAGESDDVGLLRSSMIGTLASLGDEATIAEAKRRVAALQAGDKSAVPPALRRNLQSIVAVNATPAEWDALRAAAKAEKVALIKDQYYGMLAYAEDEALAKRALELALTDEPGATNTAGMIEAVSGNFPEMTWDFAMAHRAQIDERVDATSRSQYYPMLGGSSGKEAMIAKIQDFADKYLDKGSRRTAETAIASIRNRIKVREEQLPAIDAWLAKHGGARRGGARTAIR
jgi:aminopeptidase N